MLDSPHTGQIMHSFDVFSVVRLTTSCWTNSPVGSWWRRNIKTYSVSLKRTVKMPVTWDAMTLMWRHCNVSEPSLPDSWEIPTCSFVDSPASASAAARREGMSSRQQVCPQGPQTTACRDDSRDTVTWWWTISIEHVAHDDVIKWKHFPRYWPFVRGIHRSPVNSPHKGQWRRALMFPLICALINGWMNNRDAGDLRRHRTHYDAIVMLVAITMLSTLISRCYVVKSYISFEARAPKHETYGFTILILVACPIA